MCVEGPNWPAGDLQARARAAGTRGEKYYEGAAICRRGHVETEHLKPGQDVSGIPERCLTCGANVLVACPHCQRRIRGDSYAPLWGADGDYRRPSFCDSCGSAYPWATRVERIYELENLLDEQDIDDADRVVVSDNLRRLREEEELSEKDQRVLWERVKVAAGTALTSERVAAVVEGVVSAAIRHS